MAKEKNLTAVTSVAAADFLRVVTSAGASAKATAANLAKYVIETYNGSSVAGSSQSVKNALDSLNSKTTDEVSKISSISGGTLDSNALIKVGNTVFGSARLYSISTAANGNFFTIPSGFRPTQPTRTSAYMFINGVSTPMLATINTDGTVYFGYSQSQTTTQVGFAGSWTVK